MEERNQHLTKYRAGVDGYKDHTAKGALYFLLKNFVKASEDSAHIARANILLHTRGSGIELCDWLRSMQPLIRTLIESQKKSKQNIQSQKEKNQ